MAYPGLGIETKIRSKQDKAESSDQASISCVSLLHSPNSWISDDRHVFGVILTLSLSSFNLSTSFISLFFSTDALQSTCSTAIMHLPSAPLVEPRPRNCSLSRTCLICSPCLSRQYNDPTQPDSHLTETGLARRRSRSLPRLVWWITNSTAFIL